MIGAIPNFKVTLYDPAGSDYDVTDRVALTSISGITEETEDDLTRLTHADITLTLWDTDQYVEGLLANVTRDDVIEVVIERESRTVPGSYDRVFAGVLDVPLSIQIDRGRREVQLQVWSYSKQLELASAEVIRRNVIGLTASVTAGSKTVTVSDTTDLAANDLFTLTNASGTTEQQRIATVDSSTQVTTLVAYSNTFAAGSTFTLDSPYYRKHAVSDLATSLFNLAGISNFEIDVAEQLSTKPFPGDLVTSGMPATAPVGVLETNGAKLAAYTGGNRYDAATLTSGFTLVGAEAGRCDWRPYLASAPATLRSSAAVDDGTRAWDYAGGHYYNFSLSGNVLKVQRDGVDLYTAYTKGGDDLWDARSLDYDAITDSLWVSYSVQKRTWVPALSEYQFATPVASTTRRDKTSGALVETISTTQFGYLRACYPATAVLFVAWHWNWSGVIDEPPAKAEDGSSLIAVSAGGAGSKTDLPGALGKNLKTWTFRQLGSVYVCLRVAGAAYNALVLDSAGAVLADYPLAALSGNPVVTVFDVGGTAIPAYVGYAGTSWFVLSTAFSGVIPYADFSGMSVAAALKELALYCCGYFTVDDSKIGHLLARRSATLAALSPVDIDEFLDLVNRPGSEWLRRSVEVKGKDESGNDIDVLAGDSGDSASRLQIDMKFPISATYAGVVADNSLAYFSALGQQLDGTIVEPATGILHVLDLVNYNGTTLRAIKVQTDLDKQTQLVQLVAEGS